MSQASQRPIDLFTADTPNGHKIPIALEELGLPYTVHALDLRKNESKTPEFQRINPNGKIPAIIDHTPEGDITVFESGAILIYLADKGGGLLAKSGQARADALGWLMFQMSAIGPIFGQTFYFAVFAQEKVPQAIERFTTEAKRILGVLEEQLGKHDYLAGEYSIADIACYAWVLAGLERLPVGGGESWPSVRRWLERVGARPAVQKGMKTPA